MEPGRGCRGTGRPDTSSFLGLWVGGFGVVKNGHSSSLTLTTWSPGPPGPSFKCRTQSAARSRGRWEPQHSHGVVEHNILLGELQQHGVIEELADAYVLAQALQEWGRCREEPRVVADRAEGHLRPVLGVGVCWCGRTRPAISGIASGKRCSPASRTGPWVWRLEGCTDHLSALGSELLPLFRKKVPKEEMKREEKGPEGRNEKRSNPCQELRGMRAGHGPEGRIPSCDGF